MLRRRIRIDMPVWEFILWGIVPWVLFGFFLGLLVRIADAAELPADVQRVAEKALRGEFGELEDWQHKAYTLALEQRVQLMPGRAWVTGYTPSEGFYRGKPVRWGFGCSERVCAMIMVDRDSQTRKWPDSKWRGGKVWTGYYILIELSPGRFEMRQVLDTGSKRNLQRAYSKGLVTWIDRWVDDTLPAFKKAKRLTYHSRYAIIRAEKTW